jgi:hypothetical protein
MPNHVPPLDLRRPWRGRVVAAWSRTRATYGINTTLLPTEYFVLLSYYTLLPLQRTRPKRPPRHPTSQVAIAIARFVRVFRRLPSTFLTDV